MAGHVELSLESMYKQPRMPLHQVNSPFSTVITPIADLSSARNERNRRQGCQSSPRLTFPNKSWSTASLASLSPVSTSRFTTDVGDFSVRRESHQDGLQTPPISAVRVGLRICFWDRHQHRRILILCPLTKDWNFKGCAIVCRIQSHLAAVPYASTWLSTP